MRMTKQEKRVRLKARRLSRSMKKRWQVPEFRARQMQVALRNLQAANAARRKTKSKNTGVSARMRSAWQDPVLRPRLVRAVRRNAVLARAAKTRKAKKPLQTQEPMGVSELTSILEAANRIIRISHQFAEQVKEGD